MDNSTITATWYRGDRIMISVERGRFTSSFDVTRDEARDVIAALEALLADEGARP